MWVMRVMGEGDSFLSNHSLSPLLRQVDVNKQHQLRVPGRVRGKA